MGRPLNKRYFGTGNDDQIKTRFHNGTAEVSGYIVRQKGSKTFICTDGANEARCTLVDKAQGTLAAGEMTITITDDSSNVKQVVKISGHRVTVDTGEILPWNFSNSTTDGAAEIEEEGTDDFEAD